MVDPYLELFNLTKVYKSSKGEHIVVEHFNLKVMRGEFVSIIGHSGCGKSTVLSMVAGLNDITDGGIVVAGHEIDGPGPDRGIVFQSPCLLPWMTAFDNVMLGVKKVFPHATRKEQREVVEYYLSLVGLADSMQKRPGELSGGMRQRVSASRARLRFRRNFCSSTSPSACSTR
jgi:nitrate/nitrite transport system ATP-binding protein